MAETCSVETFGEIVHEACGTITDVREYASLFQPFGLDKKEFKRLVGGFRRDQRLLDAEIREAARMYEKGCGLTDQQEVRSNFTTRAAFCRREAKRLEEEETQPTRFVRKK